MLPRYLKFITYYVFSENITDVLDRAIFVPFFRSIISSQISYYYRNFHTLICYITI
ncbi:hypothetical protein X975_16301, partial [Stegodyphus mimosarum]